jgi:hypothetical protein
VETPILAMLIGQTRYLRSILASVSRSLFWSGLWIFSVATGLASMIFMAWAFYLETTGRGALFIEPNRVLAAGELATVATGMVALMILFFRSMSRRD